MNRGIKPEYIVFKAKHEWYKALNENQFSILAFIARKNKEYMEQKKRQITLF
jgi:hypothetical protein